MAYAAPGIDATGSSSGAAPLVADGGSPSGSGSGSSELEQKQAKAFMLVEEMSDIRREAIDRLPDPGPAGECAKLDDLHRQYMGLVSEGGRCPICIELPAGAPTCRDGPHCWHEMDTTVLGVAVSTPCADVNCPNPEHATSKVYHRAPPCVFCASAGIIPRDRFYAWLHRDPYDPCHHCLHDDGDGLCGEVRDTATPCMAHPGPWSCRVCVRMGYDRVMCSDTNPHCDRPIRCPLPADPNRDDWCESCYRHRQSGACGLTLCDEIGCTKRFHLDD
jgi:hypothetical protein